MSNNETTTTTTTIAKQDGINGIKSWDEDTGSIPRLQIVDENQLFTYVFLFLVFFLSRQQNG